MAGRISQPVDQFTYTYALMLAYCIHYGARNFRIYWNEKEFVSSSFRANSHRQRVKCTQKSSMIIFGAKLHLIQVYAYIGIFFSPVNGFQLLTFICSGICGLAQINAIDLGECGEYVNCEGRDREKWIYALNWKRWKLLNIVHNSLEFPHLLPKKKKEKRKLNTKTRFTCHIHKQRLHAAYFVCMLWMVNGEW